MKQIKIAVRGEGPIAVALNPQSRRRGGRSEPPLRTEAAARDALNWKITEEMPQGTDEDEEREGDRGRRERE